MAIPMSDYSVASILGIEGSDSLVPRRRRSRTVYTREAIEKMEELYDETQYPDIQQRERLSVEIGVPEARIQVWFQNRRSRKSSKRGTRKSATTKSKKRAAPEADVTNDAPAHASEEDCQPPTKASRLPADDETKVGNSFQHNRHPGESFPYCYLPPYYSNYFSYPYFFNPAMGHPHFALPSTHNPNPTPTFPLPSRFFNMPLAASSPFMPSPIPHINISTSQYPTEFHQATGVQQGYSLSPPLFGELVNDKGAHQGSTESSTVCSDELLTQKGPESARQMFVPTLKRATRHSIVELSGADGRDGEDVNADDDDNDESRGSSPAYSLRTEGSVSLDSSVSASDSGFGQDFSSDSW